MADTVVDRVVLQDDHATGVVDASGRVYEAGRVVLAAGAYFSPAILLHPAGTCPIGDVVDASGRVHGVEGLVVADASVMPTLPRANTNLTTAAVAERLAGTLGV